MALRLALLAAALIGGLAGQAVAQPAAPQRLRGTLVSLTGDVLVLHTATGDISVQMADGWSVRATRPGSLAAVKPGVAIGVVSRGPASHPTAVAIQVFPPANVPRLGQSPWDMMPESTMTNAVVAGEVGSAGADGLTLKYDDKTVPMAIAPDVSVGMAEAGDRSELTPGLHVVVFAVTGPAGTPIGRLAIVGLNGSTPPL